MKKYILVIIILTLTSLNLFSANTEEEILKIIEDKNVKIEDKINQLNDFSFSQINVNPDLAFKYTNSAIKLNKLNSFNKLQLINSYTILGIIYKNKGFSDMSTKNHIKALNYAKEIDDKSKISVCLNNIGVVLQSSDRPTDALDYFKKSLKTIETTNLKEQISIRFYNIAEAFLKMKQYDSADYYFSKSLFLERELKSDIGIAYADYGIGLCYLNTNLTTAETHINSALSKIESIGDLELNVKVFLALSDLYRLKKDYNTSLNYVQKAMDISKKYEYHNHYVDAIQKRGEVYKNQNNQKALVDNYELLFSEINNKIKNDQVNKIDYLGKIIEFEQNERELDNLKNIQKINDLEIKHSNKIRMILIITILVAIVVFALNIYGLNKIRNKNS